jgi:hypothetical protein
MCKLIPATVLFCLLIAPCAAIEPGAKRTTVLVDDFNSLQNRYQGYRNTYQKSPSVAVATRAADARLGHEGLGMRVTADRKAMGYCGVWIHFFDVRAHQHNYFDASAFEYLSFWVKGAVGGERFKIKLADDIWIAKEDSVTIGNIREYLPDGVTNRWQQVKIPLDEKFGVNFQRLGGLTLDFDTPGRFTVFIDQIELETSRPLQVNHAPVHPSDLVAQPAARIPPHAQSRPGIDNQAMSPLRDRAVWLWSTESMLDDPAETEEFLQFCQQQGIKYVWAQLPYQMNVERTGNRVTNSRCTIRRQPELRRFLRSAHAAGLQVHALEGLPEHAQRQYHHVSIAIVDAVLEYNQQQIAVERFDGIHFDNEPYLLVGWHDPNRRKQILYEYLTLNSECQRRVRAASPRIEFGVDIPFWWQELDRHGEPHALVSFQGTRQAASLHLLEMLDNVGVMNYRDAAQGVDGMIAHAQDLLQHADGAGDVKVFLGVETCAYQPIDVLFAVGRPRSEFEQAVRSETSELSRLSRIDAHRLHVVDDGENVHVGIEVGETRTVQQKIQIANTLSRVTSAFGLGHDADQTRALQLQDTLAKWLLRDSEWSQVKPCTVRDPGTGKIHLLVKADFVVPGKITFADENAKQFAVQTKLAEEQFTKHPSYAGLAIHHYRSFRDLVRGQSTIRQPVPTDATVAVTNAR